MPTAVIMPALEMAQDTGRVVRWLKAEGDDVRKGEPLMEIETDKVTVEVEAPGDGVLAGVSAGEGEDVPVGETIAFLLAAGEDLPRETAPTAAPAEPLAAVAQPPAAGPAVAAAVPASDGGSAVVRARRPLASPKARRIARERGIDVAAVAGSGPHGAVVAADLDAGAPAGPADDLSLGTIWRHMAERTTRSWQSTPHFFLLREVDASRLAGWRETLRRRPGYERLTHTDLLVKLCATALREHPRVNASWRDGAIAANEAVNVGIAVAVEDGLVVPVVHDAHRLGLDEISGRRAELVAAAREGRLRPEDVARGTFTISNLGMYGVDAFLAIVNEPQAAILAVGRATERVVPVDGQPAVRPTMALALSFDHRVVDGARGAEFLDTLASLVEEPAGLVR